MELLYDTEPRIFGPEDIIPFMIWSTAQGTSDVTIQNEEKIVCEIHGKLIRVTKRKLSRSELISIIGAIYGSDGAISKLNSGTDIDQPWNVIVNRDEVLRFRVNITSILAEGHRGYSITIRTISSRPRLLETLNLPQEIIDNLEHRNGLILVVGATGSGKSTLLSAVLDWRMRKKNANLKILTYEAPIEYVYDEVIKESSIISQSEIDSHLPDFAYAVRNALRRKPSVILLGELRDRETIGEAITAAQTGHLVYGTLHADGVAMVIRRMVNAFDAEEKNARATDLISSLQLIVAQQLLPSTDGGRVPIREYLVFNDEIREYLDEVDIEKITPEVKKLLKICGRTFIEDAQEKFDQGLITQETLNEITKSSQGTKRNLKEQLAKLEELENKAKNKEKPIIKEVEENLPQSNQDMSDTVEEENFVASENIENSILNEQENVINKEIKINPDIDPDNINWENL